MYAERFVTSVEIYVSFRGKICYCCAKLRHLGGKILYLRGKNCQSCGKIRDLCRKIQYLGGKIRCRIRSFSGKICYLRGKIRYLSEKIRYLGGKNHYTRRKIRYINGQIRYPKAGFVTLCNDQVCVCEPSKKSFASEQHKDVHYQNTSITRNIPITNVPVI